jgi:fatty acid desaturase
MVGESDCDLVDDHSDRAGAFLRTLRTPEGISYQELRSELRVHWWRVWADLALTWLALVGLAIALVTLEGSLTWPWAFLIVPVASLVVGLLVHHLSSFLHEGAHYNLAPSRVFSDLVTNSAAAWVVLADVRHYRIGHMAHHRLLGTCQAV